MTATGTAGLVLNPATANGGEAAVAGGTVIINASGVLSFAGSGGLTLPAAITNNGALTLGMGIAFSYGGVISGTGSMTQAGTGARPAERRVGKEGVRT